MAKVLDHNGSVLFGDGGQLQLRHPFAQTIDAQDPLFDGLVPIFENQAAGSDFTRENGGGFVGRWMVGNLFFQKQIAKSSLLARNNAPQRRIVDDRPRFREALRKHFAQPFLFDRRREIQHDVQVALSATAAFDLAHFGDHEERRFHHALARQRAAPAMNQLAALRAGVETFTRDDRESQPTDNAARQRDPSASR